MLVLILYRVDCKTAFFGGQRTERLFHLAHDERNVPIAELINFAMVSGFRRVKAISANVARVDRRAISKVASKEPINEGSNT
jgi:hypothetical protein